MVITEIVFLIDPFSAPVTEVSVLYVSYKYTFPNPIVHPTRITKITLITFVQIACVTKLINKIKIAFKITIIKMTGNNKLLGNTFNVTI